MEDAKYPFFLQWHLTEKCNLRCRHCYQQSLHGEMSSEEIRMAIDKFTGVMQCWASNYKVEVSPSIHFTGGEPFLRHDLFDLLRHARQRGFAASLLSNGTLITGEVAGKLREMGVEDIQVSLDGMEPIHDDIRGRGNFQKALAGIRALVNAGVDTSINMTVSSLNYQELDPVVQLAQELGVSAVGFSRLVPCGRGKELSEYSLTPEQLAELSRRLAEADNRSGVALVSRDPLISVANIVDDYNEVPDTDFPLGGCSAGVFGITITSDGTIMPCRRMDLPIGNIRTDDFRQLWAESPVLVSLRNRKYYHGNCRTCFYWSVCRGCRAIALASARSNGKEDYLGPDPQCARYRPLDGAD
jgi:radical SAM protein with 4Fe4S-binding SPASM domain